MRDAKTRASAASHFLEEALRAQGSHRAWNDAIYLTLTIADTSKTLFCERLGMTDGRVIYAGQRRNPDFCAFCSTTIPAPTIDGFDLPDTSA